MNRKLISLRGWLREKQLDSYLGIFVSAIQTKSDKEYLGGAGKQSRKLAAGKTAWPVKALAMQT